MAWRPHEYLLKGELDNTQPGKVTGWMHFAGMKRRVLFALQGDFHRDIRGAKIHFTGGGKGMDAELARSNMEGFAEQQIGDVGDITAGLEPCDYVDYPYIEWYSKANGRVVLELHHEQLEVMGKPTPTTSKDKVSRKRQARLLVNHLTSIASVLRVTPSGKECPDGSDRRNT